MRRILVGVDESDGAAAALRWALAERELDESEVTALLAWDWLDQHHQSGKQSFDPEYDEDEAHQALLAWAGTALGDTRAAHVHPRVVCDLPAPALLDASADADLLVVGARGAGGFSGLLLGSVAQQCLHHSAIPIAIVRPGTKAAGGATTRVVAAVDGSDTAQRALRWAIEEARRRSAVVDVVNTWQEPFLGYSPYGRLVVDADDYETESHDILRNAIATADTEGVQVNSICLRRATVKGILDTAEGASLLVVGSRGHGAIKRTIFGSVATQLSHHASCPLVVVPALRETAPNRDAA